MLKISEAAKPIVDLDEGPLKEGGKTKTNDSCHS
jgi:hypothetical protein